ncbi:MAG TPA: sulfite exporter TauE/SafE family protein [Burkholderiales bacterium]|nr:sulfite exporter TauE/SafE family protein [Burkholderiales bacterium]
MDLGFNPWLAFGWCVLCGVLMSMGAGGGGILAGVGHISILGIGDPNTIKVVNQILEFSSRLVSVPLYQRQQRLVWSLAFTFGLGAPLGAIAGSWVSASYLTDMAVYRAVFGLLIVCVAARTLWEGFTGRPRAKVVDRPRTVAYGWRRFRVRFAGEHFDFDPWAAAAGGFCISFVGALLGVGGGFLVTPFMASVLLFPMYLVIGTSLVALMIPLTVSVLTYLALEVAMDWKLVAVEVPGIFVGAFIGPALNRYMNEKALKVFVAAVLLAIGIYYVVI